MGGGKKNRELSLKRFHSDGWVPECVLNRLKRGIWKLILSVMTPSHLMFSMVSLLLNHTSQRSNPTSQPSTWIQIILCTPTKALWSSGAREIPHFSCSPFHHQPSIQVLNLSTINLGLYQLALTDQCHYSTIWPGKWSLCLMTSYIGPGLETSLRWILGPCVTYWQLVSSPISASAYNCGHNHHHNTLLEPINHQLTHLINKKVGFLLLRPSTITSHYH